MSVTCGTHQVSCADLRSDDSLENLVTYSRQDPSLNPPSDNTAINDDLFNLMHGTWYSFRRHWEACFTFSKSKQVEART